MRHDFAPRAYHLTLGSHEPVLRVASGDTIVTTTVDAAGRDRSGEPASAGGNPQTGPFYIEDADPGDTLSVRLDHIWPNREHGFSSLRVVPNALDLGYPSLSSTGRLLFRIDQATKTARLESVQAADAQRDPPIDLAVGLRPMLGCFGVAPARGQAISSATSGPHGGNMDYNGFVQGVTAYFPVFVEGALLHVGDGHAWQGDGEILGTGIEISMDVTITLRLIKGKRIGWPRGENDAYIFTLGNARPLDQALQHATTEMLRWLQSDYGLEAVEANILLGTYVEYDVGNMCDPAYTMVCKLPKRVLPPRSVD